MFHWHIHLFRMSNRSDDGDIDYYIHFNDVRSRFAKLGHVSKANSCVQRPFRLKKNCFVELNKFIYEKANINIVHLTRHYLVSLLKRLREMSFFFSTFFHSWHFESLPWLSLKYIIHSFGMQIRLCMHTYIPMKRF